jgi:hypothetical protein
MLWQNHGGRHFTIAPLAVETETGRLFAAAAADVDGDGRTDLIAAGRRRSYLRNETAAAGNHSLEVQLRGRTGEPVGAIVSAHYDDGSVHAQRYGSAHSSAFSQSLLPLHFGIPAGRELTEISVVWPGGERTASVAVQSGSTRLVIDAPAAADPTRTTPAATRATEPLDGR